MSRLLSNILPPLLVAIVVIAALELLVRFKFVADYLVPAPSQVARALSESSGDLLPALRDTAIASLAGFAISAVVGIVLAVLLSSNRWVQRAFYPYAVFLQTVPLIAIAPLLVIWFGNSMKAVIASATIVSVFPIIASSLAGLLSTDPALKDLFQLYRASRRATLFKLKLPFALPSILTGLRIGAGLAVIGAIVGEFITTGTGLGGTIAVARQLQRTDVVFAGLLLSALLGIVIFLAINLVSYFALRHWHASEKST
jgi:NitT/TauT family transport system permease protein